VKNRFQNLPFKFNLQRYAEGPPSSRDKAGGCTAVENAVDPELESAWFQPSSLNWFQSLSLNWFQRFEPKLVSTLEPELVLNICFQWVSLYRYDKNRDALPRCLAALKFQSSKSAGARGIGTSGISVGRGSDASAPGGDEDEGLALEFLAYLCVRLGGGDVHVKCS
jgi:hypothetical protein